MHEADGLPPHSTAMKFLTLARVLTPLVSLISVSAFGITVHTSDFIADGTRTGFNGFEAIPNSVGFFTGGTGPYAEDGIVVEQKDSNQNGIWTGYNFWTGAVGNAWYPNGGDFGYTSITLGGGADFQDVGFNYGSGGGAPYVLYELYNNGSLVLSGYSSLLQNSVNYLGFSGGGFDTILLRDSSITNSPVVNPARDQALAIDSIEIRNTASVPDGAATIVLLACAATGMLAVRRAARSRVA